MKRNIDMNKMKHIKCFTEHGSITVSFHSIGVQVGTKVMRNYQKHKLLICRKNTNDSFGKQMESYQSGISDRMPIGFCGYERSKQNDIYYSPSRIIIAVSEGLKAETVRGIYIRDCRIVRICIYMQGIIQSGIRILTVMIRKRMSLRY